MPRNPVLFSQPTFVRFHWNFEGLAEAPPLGISLAAILQKLRAALLPKRPARAGAGPAVVGIDPGGSLPSGFELWARFETGDAGRVCPCADPR